MATDAVLAGTIIDYFLSTLTSSCLYEPREGGGDRQNIATVQPFAILCALREMMPGKELTNVSTTELRLASQAIRMPPYA